jgi:fatty acid desaturase
MPDHLDETLRFSIGEARQLVRDLFEPKPWIYWTDFLVSVYTGMAAFVAMRLLVRFDLLHSWVWGIAAICYVISVLALYRASLFTHELTHLKQDSFRSFRLAWNLLYGIPFLVPSFLYHTHVDHHARRQYGTEHDGEYLPLAQGPRWKIGWFLAECLVVPMIAMVRFLGAPLTWVCPPLRRWVGRHASSMVIDPAYVRPLPTHREIKVWRLQEVACWLLATTVAGLVLAGVLPFGLVVSAYAVSVGVMFLNAIRTLGAHRYRSNGEPITFINQLLDSVNYPHHPWIGELWAPVGLRFHALHHLFPSMPYHNLAEAHRRLMAGLPADSLYRQVNSPGLWQTIGGLWREAGRAERRARQAAGRDVRGALGA